MEWDVFISHASEDKEAVAQPLTKFLRQAGLKVWLDENELTLGDSLSKKIDEGLAHSTYGVVILSEHFFRKQWPPHELAGLAAKQLIQGRKVILPIWHGVDQSFIVRYSPPLADAVAVSTSAGLKKVADDILGAVRLSLPSVPPLARLTKLIRPKLALSALAIGVILLSLAVAVLRNYVFHSEPKPPSHTTNDDFNKPLFWRQNHGPISGYVVVSCNTCGRPRAWAFYYPGIKDGNLQADPAFDSIIRNTTLWPAVQFLYPEDKPHVSSCVDFPTHVCPEDQYSKALLWRPRHAVSKPRNPALRLQLRCLISGFELGVLNESDALAQGINVDVTAWQIRAPGAELIKSYTVHDLGPWADATIFNVFDDSQQRQKR